MHGAGYFPAQCEFDAITAAAVKACDSLDGLEDGVVGLFGACDFEAAAVVGQPYACEGVSGNITERAAAIAQSIWEGPRDAEGASQWYGLAYGASFSGLANTACANGSCTGAPFSISTDWIRVFLKRDAAFDAYAMTQADWDATFHASKQQYDSIIGTNDPNLSGFKKAGGKMITWHGTSDQLITPNGTVDYYQRVLAHDANAADYYRVYMAPGVDHCGGGAGAAPTDPLAALLRWVEEGEAPDTLAANRTVLGERWEQELCAYPLVSMYVGGEASDAASFECR
jgi:feruloyl esterase